MGVFRRFIQDDSGATAIEYSLIAGLIALVIIASVRGVGTRLNARFQTVATDLT